MEFLDYEQPGSQSNLGEFVLINEFYISSYCKEAIDSEKRLTEFSRDNIQQTEKGKKNLVSLIKVQTIVKPKPSPKSKSKIQVQNPSPKFKVQRKGTGTGADNIILQATTTHNSSHLKCLSSDGKRPSTLTFLDLL